LGGSIAQEGRLDRALVYKIAFFGCLMLLVLALAVVLPAQEER
jgi:hypothetical protein